MKQLVKQASKKSMPIALGVAAGNALAVFLFKEAIGIGLVVQRFVVGLTGGWLGGFIFNMAASLTDKSKKDKEA